MKSGVLHRVLFLSYPAILLPLCDALPRVLILASMGALGATRRVLFGALGGMYHLLTLRGGQQT
jgi:hypothetical protein